MRVNQELLEILVCPETKQPLAPASEEVLAQVNEKISSGGLRNRGGKPVEKPVAEALLREDGKILYLVDDGIPVMLMEESIELS
jgi:uncharacterized protein YbaR (Trm112 family)